MTEAVRLVAGAFAEWRAGRATNQIRRRMMLPNGVGLHSMAGAVGKYFGTKFYSSSKSGYRFLFVLYDAETAAALALFEANWLGQIRTGATTGHAADLLSNPEAEVLGVIGTGFQAQSQIAAIRCVRPSIKEVRVWGRDAERRAAFAAANGAVPVSTAEEAVRGADIVTCVTFAKDPVLEAAWVTPGTLVCAVGSNHPTRRELPADLVEQAAVVVADSVEACQDEAGDFLLAKRPWEQIVSLKDCDRQWQAGRTAVFKSVGLGVEDVAVAAHVYEHYS